MPHPSCDPRTLQKLDECIHAAQKRYIDDEIRTAARVLGIEHMLPEPLTLPLFPKGVRQ